MTFISSLNIELIEIHENIMGRDVTRQFIDRQIQSTRMHRRFNLQISQGNTNKVTIIV